MQIDHEQQQIRSEFHGLFESALLEDYFARILREVEAGAGYIEEVDFRPVTDFNINYQHFGGFAEQAAKMYESGRVSKTRFHVADELQFGMARLFSMSTGADERHFEIEKS